MADIEIILTSPSSTIKSFAAAPRRLSIPAILKPAVRPAPRRPSLATIPQHQSRTTAYHLHTCLLFTWSDLKNILLPQTLLGLVTAVSCASQSTDTLSTLTTLSSRLPEALLWVWLHLLAFTISNQTQPSSQVEDARNKPWRPLPAKRLSQPEARQLFYISSFLAIVLSIMLDSLKESLTLMCLFVLYNDMGFSDFSGVTRMLLNTAGYTMFALGAAQVFMQGSASSISAQGYVWLLIVAAIIMTTGHCSDLDDQEGDAAKGRRTIFTVFGDEIGRFSVALPMLLWTVFAPRYCDASFRSTMAVFGLGAIVVKRLANGDKAGYKTTFRLWNCWLVAVYLLPLFAKQ